MDGSPADDIVRTAQQIVTLQQVRAYVANIGPIDLANAGQLAGHLMQAEVLLGKVAAAFTQPTAA
jgi:hypothetical protein